MTSQINPAVQTYQEKYGETLSKLKILADENILCQERWMMALAFLHDPSMKWQVCDWGNSGLQIMDTGISLIDIDLLEDRRPMLYEDINDALMDHFEILNLEHYDIEEWRSYVLENYLSKGFNAYVKR